MIQFFKVIHRDQVLFTIENNQSIDDDFFSTVVHHRLELLITKTNSTSIIESNTMSIALDGDWGDVHGKYFKMLLINIVDFKRINKDTANSILILNDTDNVEVERAIALYDSQKTHLDNMSYIEHYGFCLLSDTVEGLNPNVYTLDSEYNLHRLYVIEVDGTGCNGLVPVTDMSINVMEPNQKPTEYILDLMYEVTGMNYYPKDLDNGFKIVLEMFY